MIINCITNIGNNKHTLESLPKDQPEQMVIASPCSRMCKLKYLSKEIILTVGPNF